MNNLKLSGLMYFLASAIVLMCIITAEAMYPPGYTTFKNEISNFGATKQPKSVSYEPASGIFNTVILLAGLMILIASYYQQKYFRKLPFTIPVILFGLAGVGIFPGNKTLIMVCPPCWLFYQVGFVQLHLSKLLHHHLNI